ncbi:MAG: gamma-glutamyltransferase [Oligoflexia bacterium]|nr:gamma-glutamyltransferase [Bdellovibrionales bacterium]MYE07667.1 gamma-glutamyltransferase [Oligoflexia bacterium]
MTKAIIVHIKIFLCVSFLPLFPALAQPVQTQKIIVSGPSTHLVSAVKEIYREGGNIFDAAIAGAFTLSVTHPYFVSLGCGGFALLKNRSGIQALDFRETAPSQTTEDFYVKTKLSPRDLGAAVGIPGFVAGQWAIHQKYGSLPWSRLLNPAIKLADSGFIVSGQWLRRTQGLSKKFNLSGRRIFFHSDGTPYLPGEFVQQDKLVEALRLIQRKNKTLFYNGLIAQDIIKTVRENKGVISPEDLKNYRVRWLQPLKFKFGAYQVFSMPLPSSGGIILARAAKLMEQKKINQMTLYSISEWHLLGEILSFSFRPRSQMGDLSNPSPYLKKWLSRRSLTKLSTQISLNKVKKLPVLKDTLPRRESNETTHFSIMNNKGEVVSMTLTLNGNFGSFVVTDKYGIVLNNQMDDFNTYPGKPNQFGLIQGANNKVRAGFRPLSSMSPTIVEKKGKVVMALGATGGPMIISSVLQILYRYLFKGLNLDTAVQAPRIHHQFLPRVLFVEKDRFPPIVLSLLRKRGHKIKIRDSIAKAYAVSQRKDGLLEGAFDARGEGAAGGL